MNALKKVTILNNSKEPILVMPLKKGKSYKLWLRKKLSNCRKSSKDKSYSWNLILRSFNWRIKIKEKSIKCCCKKINKRISWSYPTVKRWKIINKQLINRWKDLNNTWTKVINIVSLLMFCLIKVKRIA